MLNHDRTIEHGGVIDYELSINVSDSPGELDDCFIDLVVSVHGEVGEDPTHATLDIIPNVQGEQQTKQTLQVGISLGEAKRLLELSGAIKADKVAISIEQAERLSNISDAIKADKGEEIHKGH